MMEIYRALEDLHSAGKGHINSAGKGHINSSVGKGHRQQCRVAYQTTKLKCVVEADCLTNFVAL